MAGQKKFETKDFSDADLVDASTETIGSAPSQKSLWAQSELTRRLMESIRIFDKSTAEYSDKIVKLTLVLGVIACLQLFVAIMALQLPYYPWTHLIVYFLFLGLIFWVFGDLFKNRDSKK